MGSFAKAPSLTDGERAKRVHRGLRLAILQVAASGRTWQQTNFRHRSDRHSDDGAIDGMGAFLNEVGGINVDRCS